MEAYLTTLFENVTHERSLILLLSLTDPDILKQANFTNIEKNFIKNLAFEKIHRQRILKEEVAIALLEAELEQYLLFNK